MVIKSLYETSYSGMHKVTAEVADCTTSFFIRKEYLPTVCFDSILPEAEFNELQTGELLDAGIASTVELKALEYIARAEQCRFNLTRKLIEKKFEKKYVEMALDYLEKSNFLNDERFSKAWLNTRKINHYEGRTKLIAELQARGINANIAKSAVNAFFEENDEFEICQKALDKLQKKGKTEEKLIAAMMQAGFPYKMIKEVL